MTTAKFHFYFDYLSPYAYFSWRQLPTLCQHHGYQLVPHPVVFGKLLDHWGQLGPAEVVPKKAALYRFCYRYAEVNGFTFNPPRFHPFNPLTALRLSLPEVCGEHQATVISAIFEAGWSQGADIGSEQELLQILDRAGLDSGQIMERAKQPSAKQALRQQTEQAVQQQVFGVPTFIVNEELFWGHDQLPHLELVLQGKDPLNNDKVEEMLARHRAIDRKTLTGRVPTA